MTTTIQLPDDLRKILSERAKQRKQTLETHVIEILRNTTEGSNPSADSRPAAEELAALVERIRSRPSRPSAITMPRQSLSKILALQPEDPSFNLEEWEQEWANVEREMRRIELEDALKDLKLEL